MILHSPKEMEQWAQEFAKPLEQGTVVALHGELGVGKTTCAQFLIASRTHHTPYDIVSPTFTYLQSYGQSPTFHHFDLYRMPSLDAFVNQGFHELLHAEDAICLIEWPERIAPLLPQETIHIWLTYHAFSERHVAVS